MKNIEDLVNSIAGDPEKAEVLKAHIKETEETKRAQANSENFQTTRWLATGAVVLVALFASCVGHRAIEAWERVKTPVAAVVAPAVSAVPAASAAPATDVHR